MTKTKLQDKKAITHLFAGLMAQPERLSQTKEYALGLDDFPDKIHQIIYAAIKNLQLNGANRISPIEIDGYLSSYSDQYRIYNDNEGSDYLFKLEELGEPENFSMHYNRVKKFTFLRECKKSGIDVSDIYDENAVDLKEEKERNDRFNETTLEEMIKHIELKMIQIKEQFLFDQNAHGSHMAENVKDMIDAKKLSPSYGASFQSGYLNTVTRGMLFGKLYCISGSSGSGKTRTLLSMVLSACVPKLWDIESQQWVLTGANGSGLFISTELEEAEVKIPAVCFIAGIEEEKVHNATLTVLEEERLDIAYEILAESKMWFEELHDFDIEDLEHVIVKNINKNDVRYVAFDYIHTTLKLFDSMGKQGARNLQEHQVLRILTIYLKNMCKNHQIWMGTATQLNENFKLDGNMDQSALEGSKSIVNKLDFAAIQLPLSEKDEAIIEAIMKSGVNIPFGEMPTHSINVYKNRGNRWKFIRIFISFDTGTLRSKDLFVLSYKNELIERIIPRRVVYTEAPIEQTSDTLPAPFDF
jgi:replicative DNA helicase